MAYISEAKHRELDSLLCQFLEQKEHTEPEAPDTGFLEKDRGVLQEMFGQYQDRVAELLQLIRKYQDLHRKTRIKLRKLQLYNKQQGVADTSTTPVHLIRSATS